MPRPKYQRSPGYAELIRERRTLKGLHKGELGKILRGYPEYMETIEDNCIVPPLRERRRLHEELEITDEEAEAVLRRDRELGDTSQPQANAGARDIFVTEAHKHILVF